MKKRGVEMDNDDICNGEKVPNDVVDTRKIGMGLKLLILNILM